MIDAKRLLAELQARQKKLEDDLRQQARTLPELKDRLAADYQAARAAERTADTFNSWLDGEITQAAVAWLLACAFVRFCEDNGLLRAPRLAGPGDRLRLARDAASEFFRQHPTLNERHWLEHIFEDLAAMPALTGLFGRAHNPLFAFPLSWEAARDLLAFWQRTDPDTGLLRHDFTDPALDTRFLGDLYQDLSEAARKRYALLQTPDFVEGFILDRTLEPAIEAFGLDGLRLIDPTCGSGHFLLGAFARLLDHWQRKAPGLDARERVIRALQAIHGVDLNPFAIAIARFRLLVAALQASGVRTLHELPGWDSDSGFNEQGFNLAVGDSLLHGPRLGEGELGLEQTGIVDEYTHVYAAEDFEALHRILGQRYHAVVGNPPYITASDKALNQLYRARYTSCHRKFSLGVPFTERFFQLARLEDRDGPPGFVGLITADSFMKREFGKKLIEAWLPRQDLTHVIHTSGAYIPGHGTPTVILFGRNRAPVAGTVRAVLGIRGEPSTPEDPAQGLVWRSIVELTDQPGASNDYISVADMERTRLAKHPWSLQGGVAPEVLEAINASAASKLVDRTSVIGVFGMTNADEVMLASEADLRRLQVSAEVIRPLVLGDGIRDWTAAPETSALFPYDGERLLPVTHYETLHRWLWPTRTVLGNRATFGRATYFEEGRPWWEWHQVALDRLNPPLSITFAFVATHNHFVLDRGGKVFKQSAPVVKLPAGASEDEHLGLLGLLNSSTACFWMKQRFFNKGDSTDSRGARVTGDPAFDTYEFAGTGLADLPLPEHRPLELTRQLDQLARERQAQLPAALAARLPLPRAELDAHRSEAARLFARMVALQEELDWWCYHAYGLADEKLCFAGEPPGIAPGERAFEIVLARRIAAGEAETRWFERHGLTPITEIPGHWPAGYRALVERRIALIGAHPWLALLERPEYKRRWNQPGWDALEKPALRGWLLDRMEGPAWWPEAALQTVPALATRAERDAEFMAVATLYTGQHAFEPAALVRELIEDESVPALAVLRYRDSGLRKRADWEDTWAKQRQEDAIDAAVAADLPRQQDETEADWQARIQPTQAERKESEIGRLAAPPKYRSTDFLRPAYWRLRGGLDVPKERFYTVPDPEHPGEWLYGWAGHNPAERVQALAAACVQAEAQGGAEPARLLPLLAAIDEQLPWVLQWHNAITPDSDEPLGDFFQGWLREQLNRHGWNRQTLTDWRPAPTPRRGRRPRAG